MVANLVAFLASDVGHGMLPTIERSQSQRRLPGIGMTLLAIVGERSVARRDGTGPKGSVTLNEIEARPQDDPEDECRPIPAAFPGPRSQRLTGVIQGILLGDQLLIVSAGHGQSFL